MVVSRLRFTPEGLVTRPTRFPFSALNPVSARTSLPSLTSAVAVRDRAAARIQRDRRKVFTAHELTRPASPCKKDLQPQPDARTKSSHEVSPAPEFCRLSANERDQRPQQPTVIVNPSPSPTGAPAFCRLSASEQDKRAQQPTVIVNPSRVRTVQPVPAC